VKVFTNEFKNWLKRVFVCSWIGHKRGEYLKVFSSEFVFQYLGYEQCSCTRCRKELDRRNVSLSVGDIEYFDVPGPYEVTHEA
jgi:hypothetical protein